ncbi:Abi-alpha family protein [Paracoccus sp. (in: a-proteobacteria)]|uniref:Abi-alpha family protein n=1 Tax=Paracoccus sp. TaxID=267 RepID=UPI00272D8CC3|nr:Abi-alpha family protein [Paracoccus sp. (in: a-proteobacteria)]
MRGFALALPVSFSVTVPGQKLDEALSDLLSSAIGPALHEIGALAGDLVGLVRDPVKEFRAANQRRILGRTVQRMEAKGIKSESARALPLREAVSVIQSISDVDEPNLSELWAGLIASARDPKLPQGSNRAYQNTMGLLAEADAALFQAICLVEQLRAIERRLLSAQSLSTRAEALHPDVSEVERSKIFAEHARRHEALVGPQLTIIRALLEGIESPEQLSASSENLLRLGLIQPLKAGSFPPNHTRRGSISAEQLMRALENTGRERQHYEDAARKAAIVSQGNFIRLAATVSPWGKRFAAACQIGLDEEWLQSIKHQSTSENEH